MFRTLSVTIFAVLLSACASSGGQRDGSSAPDRNLITAEEIASVSARDAYEIVQRLRPDWLRTPMDRSARFGTVIGVYYNNNRVGEIESLRSIEATGVRSMRFLDAAQARALPSQGMQHMAGAIVVSTRGDGS